MRLGLTLRLSCRCTFHVWICCCTRSRCRAAASAGSYKGSERIEDLSSATWWRRCANVTPQSALSTTRRIFVGSVGIAAYTGATPLAYPTRITTTAPSKAAAVCAQAREWREHKRGKLPSLLCCRNTRTPNLYLALQLLLLPINIPPQCERSSFQPLMVSVQDARLTPNREGRQDRPCQGPGIAVQTAVVARGNLFNTGPDVLSGCCIPYGDADDHLEPAR